MNDRLLQITNATREVAECLHRFRRADERLVRQITAAREEGIDEKQIGAAISLATRGRPDIARKLEDYAKSAQELSS